MKWRAPAKSLNYYFGSILVPNLLHMYKQESASVGYVPLIHHFNKNAFQSNANHSLGDSMGYIKLEAM